MRKLKPRKSTEANLILHLCKPVVAQCICDLDKVCKCTVEMQCKVNGKELPSDNVSEGIESESKSSRSKRQR